ncbi:hypothetical protein DPMN_151995 [Dreissena polymorpha]|uniref:Uncharacterized protein n=1 Tax=Dreissena polymorpha TaxID=45954 RepID=A0A9D4J3H4_DREPO|nr:hypothetical protein DPMN_151995 [Dreissena polymorpha]
MFAPMSTQASLRGQLINGRVELEVLGEQLMILGVHELVRLSNGHLCHAGYVSNLCKGVRETYRPI